VTSIEEAARQVMALYPRIYFACHSRHVRDPESRRLLSRHQASILDHLDEIEPTTLNELARHMGVTTANTSIAWSGRVTWCACGTVSTDAACTFDSPPRACACARRARYSTRLALRRSSPR
jgi:hypothetical protein